MKACGELSPVKGLYMAYAYNVHVRGTAVCIWCPDISKVRSACKYLRKRYPGKCLRVHRQQVVDGVDNQMRRKSIAKIVELVKEKETEHD